MIKQFRVDTFENNRQEKSYFDMKEDALLFGNEEVKKGKLCFLLKHIVDGKYDVACEIK